ncbi:Sugar phosphate permease [Pseudarcicella hirudinis]|uniref:Sugar phosphate permease n=2 Tax=Pseudarcicella hirudinis TaxID=1079859 RepID=A0A1I5UZ64_9BACT|nr:MFS transporter [Pseudarcicella hirudinis]SFQ00337.1 Sugar phosphate permease [Pseudarcicella hirudinis]
MIPENNTTETINTSNWKHQYYPIIICFSGLLILLIINGLTTTTISVFDKSLLDEFHWTRSELKWRDSLTNGTAFAFILFSGILIDKIRVKKLMLSGAVLLTVALFSYSFITSKFQAYFLHILMGLSYATAGSISAIILVSSWFKEHRGIALGVTLAGTSLGGFIFPPLIGSWIDLYSWRDAFMILSILPLALFFYILLIVKNAPSEIGSVAYGEDRNISEKTSDLLDNGLTLSEAFKTRTFWLICICGMFTFYSVVGIVSNIFMNAIGLGFSETNARWLLTLYFGIAFLGKFAISSLSDYFNTYIVFTVCCVALMLGSLGFATLNLSFLIPATIITALSWGGIYTLYNVLTVKTFGLKSAGKINGTISMFESAGAFVGPVLTGCIYDKTESYRNAFLIITFIMFLATVLSLNFKKAGIMDKQ